MSVVERRPAGEGHQVITVETSEGARWRYRRRPCPGCPWRVDQTGQFPAEAFEASARCAHDLATHMFGCHESGEDRPATCAGFLLAGAEHNLTVRVKAARGEYDPASVTDGGHLLHENYVAMAVANGADPETLEGCRR